MRVKAAVAGRACNNVRVLESFQIYVSQKEGIQIHSSTHENDFSGKFRRPKLRRVSVNTCNSW